MTLLLYPKLKNPEQYLQDDMDIWTIEALSARRLEYQNKIRKQMEELFFLSMELDTMKHSNLVWDISMNVKILWRLDAKLNQALQREGSGPAV